MYCNFVKQKAVQANILSECQLNFITKHLKTQTLPELCSWKQRLPNMWCFFWAMGGIRCEASDEPTPALVCWRLE